MRPSAADDYHCYAEHHAANEVKKKTNKEQATVVENEKTVINPFRTAVVPFWGTNHSIFK